jgi:hypothetical protein
VPLPSILPPADALTKPVVPLEMADLRQSPHVPTAGALPQVHPPDVSLGQDKPLQLPHLGLPGIVAPPATPLFEEVPLVSAPDPLATHALPKLGELPLAPVLPELPMLPRVPTLPEVSLIPGVPDIALLPRPSAVRNLWQEVGELGQGLAPVNVAGMFENSPAHLAAFPTIKYLPDSVLDFINKVPFLGGRFPFNAVVLLPIPKQQLKPPTLPHAAIPGFLTIDTIIHGLFGDVLWNALPANIRGPLQPAKTGISNVLDMVSIFFRFWQVYWQPMTTANHVSCRLWLTNYPF